MTPDYKQMLDSAASRVARVQDEPVRDVLYMLTEDYPRFVEMIAELIVDLEHANDELRRNPQIQVREFHDDGRGFINDWRDAAQGDCLDFIERRPTIQVRIKP